MLNEKNFACIQKKSAGFLLGAYGLSMMFFLSLYWLFSVCSSGTWALGGIITVFQALLLLLLRRIQKKNPTSSSYEDFQSVSLTFIFFLALPLLLDTSIWVALLLDLPFLLPFFLANMYVEKIYEDYPATL